MIKTISLISYLVVILMLVAGEARAHGRTFQRTYGGNGTDVARSIQPTNDGGYIVAGYTTSFGAGLSDVYLMKIDSMGNKLWSRTYGGPNQDAGFSCAVMADGGFAIAGYTESFGAGSRDVYLIRTDANGDTLWTKTFGGNEDERGYSIQRTSDDGLIIAGALYGSSYLAYIIRTNSAGDTLWTRLISSGRDRSSAEEICLSQDGGFAFIGLSSMVDFPRTGSFVMKIDSLGNRQWISVPDQGYGSSVTQLLNGNYMYTAFTWCYLIDSGGTYINRLHIGAAIARTARDNGAIVLLRTSGIGLLRMDDSMHTVWQRTVGSTTENGLALQQTGDRGFIVAGTDTRKPSLNGEVYVAKTDSGGYLYTNAQLLSPAGGEVWQIGTVHNITWINPDIDTATGGNKLLLQLSTNGGSTWLDLTAGPLFIDLNSFTFTVPNFPSTACKIRILRASDLEVLDESKSAFTITSGSTPNVTLTGPNKGEHWHAGGSDTIRWSQNGTSSLKLFYSLDNTQTWKLIDSSLNPASGMFIWSTPDTTDSLCRIRIEDSSNPLVSDLSDSVFSLIRLNVLVPNGGEQLSIWRTRNVQWSTQTVKYVKLDYSTDNGSTWLHITSLASPKIGNYLWPVPATPSMTCRMKVWDPSYPHVQDYSDSTFTILAPAVALLSPNGGENLFTGSKYRVAWSNASIDSLSIDYSTDGGGTWLHITRVRPDSGAYLWSVPKTPSSQCKIRISDTKDPNLSDMSDAVFSITTPIAVVSPNGGEHLRSGDLETIRWSSNGIIDVTVDYTTNNGASWTAIRSFPYPADSGKYDWILPAVESDSCRVRVNDASNLPTSDLSDAMFSIRSTNSVATSSDFPITYSLAQNYPNPFNPSATITYGIPSESEVKLMVYNVLGEEIAVLVDRIEQAGNKTVSWNASAAPSGVYLYRLLATSVDNPAKSFAQMRKMVLMR